MITLDYKWAPRLLIRLAYARVVLMATNSCNPHHLHQQKITRDSRPNSGFHQVAATHKALDITCQSNESIRRLFPRHRPWFFLLTQSSSAWMLTSRLIFVVVVPAQQMVILYLYTYLFLPSAPGSGGWAKSSLWVGYFYLSTISFFPFFLFQICCGHSHSWHTSQFYDKRIENFQCIKHIIFNYIRRCSSSHEQWVGNK